MSRRMQGLGGVVRMLGLAACFYGVGLVGCAKDNIDEAGSQSNWLECKNGKSCPSDLQCECGICTRACDAHEKCSDLHARASCEATTDLESLCGISQQSTKRVCVLECLKDSDCGDDASNLSCRDGVCIGGQSAPSDASASDAMLSDADASAPFTLDVEVLITADNAYGFGYGTDTSLRNYFGGVSNSLAEQIFHCDVGPESYTVPAADAQPGDTLYIIAWADAATTQGVLGQFRRGNEIVYTGEGNWSVCATGVRFEPSTSGPDMIEINRQIGLCNTGATDPATTSAGWVDSTGNGTGALAIGESNETGRDLDPVSGNEFPLTCGIDPDARWMWFNWDPQNISWPAQTPFIFPIDAANSGNPDKQFLIFKLAADEVLGLL